MIAFWFRRDLRLEDNHGLWAALNSGHPVLPLFIFDSNILSRLPRRDARVSFLHQQLQKLHAQMGEHGAGLLLELGQPKDVWSRLLRSLPIRAIYCNEDYEPYAIQRDQKIAKLTRDLGREFHTFQDQVIFAKSQITKPDGEPYRMFTPYSKRWLLALNEDSFRSYPSRNHLEGALVKPPRFLSLEELGFESSSVPVSSAKLTPSLLQNYTKCRDGLALQGTSKAGPHLRFGTLSVRGLAKKAHSLGSTTYLKELIWREFFMQMLYHYPKTATEPFDPRYQKVPWRNDRQEFERWCSGETGVPIVDAGMRELNQTGYMHNRVRMITASFLTKHLLIDWRWGERYFAEKLLDFELASNVGNWQWAAGCGCDAAPYFRVFNPMIQARKFDSKGEYVRKWIPELGHKDYPQPMVDLDYGRRRAIATIRTAISQ